MHCNMILAYVKAKAQISCAVTAQLISAFDSATWIVQSFFFLNLKFQASSLFSRLYRSVCVGPSRNFKERFSRVTAHMFDELGVELL